MPATGLPGRVPVAPPVIVSDLLSAIVPLSFPLVTCVTVNAPLMVVVRPALEMLPAVAEPVPTLNVPDVSRRGLTTWVAAYSVKNDNAEVPRSTWLLKPVSIPRVVLILTLDRLLRSVLAQVLQPESVASPARRQ